jgi:hypothetical protein
VPQLSDLNVLLLRRDWGRCYEHGARYGTPGT